MFVDESKYNRPCPALDNPAFEDVSAASVSDVVPIKYLAVTPPEAA